MEGGGGWGGLLRGRGAVARGVGEDQGAPSLGVGIPDVLPWEVGVPGGGHELKEPARAAGAVDRKRVVTALAVGDAQRPGEPRTVREDGVQGGQPLTALAVRRSQRA